VRIGLLRRLVGRGSTALHLQVRRPGIAAAVVAAGARASRHGGG
jgi:hypothetical protein